MATKFTERRSKILEDDEELRAEYEALEPQFQAIRALISARTTAGISQAELARRVGVTQPAIGRIEAGRTDPRIGTLAKTARALGYQLTVELKPLKKKMGNERARFDREGRPRLSEALGER